MLLCEPATYDHAAWLAPALSFLDRREAEIYGKAFNLPETVYEHLMKSVEISRETRCLTDDDQPLAIWGVKELMGTDGKPFGAPWLLSVDPERYTRASTKALLIETRKSIKHWHRWYDRLEGFSWANAVEHHKLLKKLGFEFSEVITKTDAGVEVPPTVCFCRELGHIKRGEPYYVRG